MKHFYLKCMGLLVLVWLLPYLSQAQPTPFINGHVYKIVNRYSGKVLEVEAGSTADGAVVRQWDCLGFGHQQWRVIDGAIINCNSNKVLEIQDGANFNTARIQQWTDLFHGWQRWNASAAATGTQIVSRHTNKVVEIAGASKETGALAQQFQALTPDDYPVIDHQYWTFVDVTPAFYNSYFGGNNWLINRNASKYLTTGNGLVIEDGAPAMLGESTGGSNWQWVLVPTGPNTEVYSIINRLSGKALEVEGGSTANGARVQQRTFQGASYQLWRIQVYNPDTYSYKIINVNSNKVLEIAGGSTADGALAQQWDFLGYNWQLWFPSITKLRSSVLANTDQRSESNQNLSVFPSLATETVHFTLEGTKVSSVRITDANGRQVHPRFITSNSIDVTSLASGVYVVTVGDGKKEYKQKFIKQ